MKKLILNIFHSLIVFTLLSCQKDNLQLNSNSQQSSVQNNKAQYANFNGEKIPLPSIPLEQELKAQTAFISPMVNAPFLVQKKETCQGVVASKNLQKLPENILKRCQSFEQNGEGMENLKSYLVGLDSVGNQENKALCLEAYCTK